MKNRELLSVLIPVYNTESYFSKCVNSILNQTYSPLEIILVDDGSTDSSGRLCDFFAEKYDNVSVIHIKNSGITTARLKGVEACQGKWVTFVDSDDWIDANYYKTVCVDDDSDLIITEMYGYYDEKNIIKHELNYTEGIYNKDKIFTEIVPNMLWDTKLRRWALEPSLCTKIFKREKILDELRKVEKVGSDYGEDSMVTFPLLLQIRKLRIVKSAFYYYRQRKQGEIADYIRNDNFIEKVHKVYEYLVKEFKDMGYYELMKNQLNNFYIISIDLKKKCYPCREYEFAVVFPFQYVSKNSRVVLYGAGLLGRKYIEQNSRYNFCNIILWVDKNVTIGLYSGYSIENPEVINLYLFDYVVIAIDNYFVAMEAREYLCKLDIPQEKIIWHSTRIDKG